MQRISNFFRSQNFQKYAALGVLLIILAIIPITLSQVSSPSTTQTVSQHAASGNFNQNICGVNIVNSDVSPQCHLLTAPNACHIISTAQNNTNGTYNTQIALHSTDGKQHTVVISYWQFFCTNGDISPNPLCSCNSSGGGEQKVTSTTPVNGNPVIIQINRSNDSPFQGQTCGTFQYDFIVKSVDGNQSCSSGVNSDNPAGWSICQTGVNCGITPTNTPTPGTTVTPTNTPTPGITITDTPTPGITITDTPTPGLTITPTDTPTNTPTPTATGTVTPAPSATPTPTGNPTATPTTVVPTTTPKPTLPPTGPGGTFIAVGFVGLAVAVLGVLVGIGL